MSLVEKNAASRKTEETYKKSKLSWESKTIDGTREQETVF